MISLIPFVRSMNSSIALTATVLSGYTYRKQKKTDASIKIENEMGSFFRKMQINNGLVLRDSDVGFFALGLNIPFGLPPTILVQKGMCEVDEHATKFLVKHETGHLYANDVVVNCILQIASSLLVAGLTKKLIKCTNKQLVTKFNIITNAKVKAIAIAIGICGLMLVNYITTYISNKYMLWREGRADDFAIKHSTLEEKLGGRRYFIALLNLNMHLLNKFPNTLRKSVSSNGENLLDVVHPSLSSRAKKIEKNIANNKNIDWAREDEKIRKLTKHLIENVECSISYISMCLKEGCPL